MFQRDFFISNRHRLRQLVPDCPLIVLTANGLLQRAGDEAYPFHQDANFWYLTGVDEPDIQLVIDGASEYLVVPKRHPRRAVFDGTLDYDELARQSGVSDVVDDSVGWQRLRARVRQARHLATPLPSSSYLGRAGLYTNPARARLMRRLRLINHVMAVVDLRKPLAQLRVIKQPPELLALQRAIDITVATLQEVSQAVRLGQYHYEYEVEADISRGFRRGGAHGHGFAPIVASGKHACTLHNSLNGGAVTSGELLLVDVGAEFNHYVADLTRTYALNGAMPSRQAAVYRATQATHGFARSILKPGVYLRDYEQQVTLFIAGQLRALGLIKTMQPAAIRRYFPHATSHFLGINAHDAGDYDQPLRPGMVLTVEPGIYLPEEGIGVRLEDDVLITDEGNRVLSATLSFEPVYNGA